MKYSEGYLRTEEPSVVRFVPDFTRQKTQKHQRKALVCVSKTTKETEGCLRAEEPSFCVIRPRFQIQNQTMASVKGSGPREQDRDKVVSDTYALQHHE
jgi:hypothetical protein